MYINIFDARTVRAARVFESTRSVTLKIEHTSIHTGQLEPIELCLFGVGRELFDKLVSSFADADTAFDKERETNDQTA